MAQSYLIIIHEYFQVFRFIRWQLYVFMMNDIGEDDSASRSSGGSIESWSQPSPGAFLYSDAARPRSTSVSKTQLDMGEIHPYISEIPPGTSENLPHNSISIDEVASAADNSLSSLARYRTIFRPFVTPKVFQILVERLTSVSLGSRNEVGTVVCVGATASRGGVSSKQKRGKKWSNKKGNAKAATNGNDMLTAAADEVPDESAGEDIITQPRMLSGHCKLRSYQLEGLAWLADHYERCVNCILADEMGLGKTLQSIALVAHLVEKKGLSGPFLFVVPLSVLFNWIAEFRRWCPSLSLLRLHATEREEQERLREKLRDPHAAQVVVTTYDTIKTSGLGLAVQRIVWRCVFLDEGHKIKNSESDVSKTCHKIRARFRVVLTGTPVQNDLREFGSLLQFLAPNLFTDLGLFEAAFKLQAGKGRPAVNNGDVDMSTDSTSDHHPQSAGSNHHQQEQQQQQQQQQQSLSVINRELLTCAHRLMEPFVLRRLKSEVEQRLPPKQETKIDCPMTPLQRDLTRLLLLREMPTMVGVDEQTKVKTQYSVDGRSQQCAGLEDQNGEPPGGSGRGRGNGSSNDTQAMDLSASELHDGEENDGKVVLNASAGATAEAVDSVEGGPKGSRMVIGTSAGLQGSAATTATTTVDVAATATAAAAGLSIGMTSLITQLRKAANHPFLFPGIEKVQPDLQATEEIVTASGKMLVLDKLLSRLFARGHRCVLFSQYTRTLDIICDYLEMRDYSYFRLDGSTNRVMREVKINLFNKPGSETQMFCLSTRAGGEGVNLYSADTVILFDRFVSSYGSIYWRGGAL